MTDIYASIFPPREMCGRLRDGDIDCALVHRPNDASDIGAVLIGEASLVAVMSSSDPLAARDCIDVDDLAGRQVITFPARLAFARIIRNLIGNSFGTRRIQTNYTSMAMQLAAPASRHSNRRSVPFRRGRKSMGLCKRPLDAEAGVSVGLVYSTSRKSPELLKAFELCLREIASEMSLSP